MSLILIERIANLNGPIIPDTLNGVLNGSEIDAHKFIITATRDGATVALTGAVTASFLRADGAEVVLTGEIENGAATVTLAQSCYAVPGRFDLTIFVTADGVKTGVYACTGGVRNTTSGTIIDPGEIVPSVDDIIAKQEELAQDVADASSAIASAQNAVSYLAPGFSTSKTYEVGEYVTQDGALYICTTAVETAGEWDATKWQAVTFGGEVSDFKSAIWQAIGGIADYNLFGSAGFVRGYYINAQGVETAGIGFSHTGIISVTPSQTYHFSGTGINRQAGWTMRFHAYKDGVWSRQLVAANVPATGGAIEQDMTLVSGENGVAISFVTGAVESPVFVGPDGETAIDRVARSMFTDYLLQSTGDATNRTADILARLTADKVCRLGDGVFYVQNLDMPDDSAIIGSGAGTKIILLGTDATDGYAVKLGSRCSISHVSVLGNAEDHTANADRYDRDAAYVERHGILFEGNVTPSVSGDTTRRANVTDCYIANFSGGGITLQKTGLNTISGINVSDCYIWHCYAGINVAYYSEFNRFANVSVGFCHYGAINNGGNNVFTNCNFSANIEGMLIDNTNGKSPNNSHGSVSNCIFDHSDQNYGIGIHLIGASFGEVFSNCQLFFSEIVLENSNGIVFSSLNAGNNESITVKNCKGVTFASCMFRTQPWFITTGNQKMIVRDCLAYDEAAVADVVLSNVDVTAMPVDFTGAIGQTATFSVTAENVASYQWQWRYADHSRGWTDTTAAGNKTASISVEITAARLAYEYRCVMLDNAGNAAYTDTVRIIQS